MDREAYPQLFRGCGVKKCRALQGNQTRQAPESPLILNRHFRAVRKKLADSQPGPTLDGTVPSCQRLPKQVPDAPSRELDRLLEGIYERARPRRPSQAVSI